MTHRFQLVTFAVLLSLAAALGAVRILVASGAPGMFGPDGFMPSTAVFAVVATEFAFAPSVLEVDVDENITLTLTNGGRAPHDITFELDGGRVEQSDTIRGAEVATMTFAAPSMVGSYIFYCSIGQHRQQGMEGKLNVSPGPVEYEEVAGGLLSPRGLAISGDMLLVAEGGTGADGMGFRPGNNDGRVTMLSVSDPTSRTVVVDALTNAVDPGGGVIGANHAIWPEHDPEGGILVALSGGPGHPDPKGKILLARNGVTATEVVDMWAFEEANNPDDGEIDSNPWRIVEKPDGDLFVSDSGGNSVVRVPLECAAADCLSLFAVFEPVGMRENGAPISAVPTGLAWDEGTGELFVALLGSVVDGEAQVRRLSDENEDGDALDDGENTLVLDGLTMAVDLAFSPSGRLYVLEFGGRTAEGRLTEVQKITDGIQLAGLYAPSAIVFDDEGDALVAEGDPTSGYVTHRIVRIPADLLEPGVDPTPTTPPDTHTVYLPWSETP